MAPRKTAASKTAPPKDDDVEEFTDPTADLVVREPALDDDVTIPDELQFTSDIDDDYEAVVTAFSVNGQTLGAIQPTRGALILLTGSLSDNATEADQIHGIMRFFSTVLTPASKEWLNRYMKNPRFDENVLMDIIVALAKKWDALDLLPKSRTQNRAQRRAAGKH